MVRRTRHPHVPVDSDFFAMDLDVNFKWFTMPIPARIPDYINPLKQLSICKLNLK